MKSRELESASLNDPRNADDAWSACSAMMGGGIDELERASLAGSGAVSACACRVHVTRASTLLHRSNYLSRAWNACQCCVWAVDKESSIVLDTPIFAPNSVASHDAF